MDIIARYNYQTGRDNRWISYNTESPIDSYIIHRNYVNNLNNVEKTITNLNGIVEDQLTKMVKQAFQSKK